MALSRTIPNELHAAVLARLGEKDPATGLLFTSRAVAAWLLDEHQVQCSHMAVVRLHAGLEAQGEQRIVAALREEIRDAVGPAVKRLVRASKKLDEALKSEADTRCLATGTRALTGALDSLAKLGGVAAPVQVDVTSGGQPLPDARTRLAESLARLTQEPEPRGAGEAPGGPAARNG